MRAADVPEYVQDGVVDCGITGIDLVRERGAAVSELLPLGFGGCRLEAAVPEESPVTSLAELAGASVATVYPHLTRELLPFDVELVDVTGSVEIAPRLGLADAIVDLVSSGNTLRTNGLRSLGVLLESEAVLVARDEEAAAPFAAMLRAVVEARRHRYVMLNAPRESAAGDRASRQPARAERAAARRGRDGRRARARSLCRRLAAAARARSCGRLVDPDRPRRADDDDDRGRRQGARARGGPRMGVEARRRRAGACERQTGAIPREAILELADRVRRWHAVQRPPDVSLEVEPGVVLERRWVRARHGRHLRAAEPHLDARHVRRAGAGRRRAADRRLHAARRRGDDRRGRRAARPRGGLGARWAAGDRLPRLRRAGRQDRRPGQRLRERREARGLARRADRPARRAVGGGRARRRRPAARRARAGRAARARPRGGVHDRRLARGGGARSRPSTSCCSATPRRDAAEVRNAGSVFVGPLSPVAAGDYATGGNHVLPTNGWARSVGGLGLETFLKPVTVQRLTEQGLARIRPTIEALAAAEGMPAHAAAAASMRALAPEFRPYAWAMPTGEVARLAGIDPSQVLRFDQNTPPLPAALDASGRDRRRARARQRLSRRAATARCARRSRTTRASTPENVVLGAGADDLILLCARAFAGPGDDDRDPAGADLPALPHRGAARRSARSRLVRRRISALAFACRPNNPTGELRSAPGRAAARRRRGVLRVQRRDRGAAARRRRDRAAHVLEALRRSPGARIGYALAAPRRRRPS